ncbi:cupin domain-containing protein [Lyngbya sp. CCY1209]|uniref:cupin domain-containing protein n=1 Tax=Lyngbya sp. CCY1209 TaxID=2886103 RepID=UPI002D20AFE2|nr:cupin domain-containing protein [Lyngbya sp. CCY1209]MEB3886491.1 cupin domain-containing protein [Lyngbya sp. CCY1209]
MSAPQLETIRVQHQPSPEHLRQLGVSDWPIWTKGVSEFPWTYDEAETCYLLAGEVTVTPDGGRPVELKPGDLVTFSRGLSCTWTIRAPVKKHYQFS